MATHRITHHKKHARRLLLLRIATGLAVLGVGISVGVWVYVAGTQTGSGKQDSVAALREAVMVDTVESGTATISSKLGFRAAFNKNMLDVDAKVIKTTNTADVYTEDDALVERSYAVADFVVKKSVTNSSGIGLSFPPSLAVLTNANKDFFERQRAKTPGLSDEQLVIAHYAPQPAAGSTAALVSQESEQLGAVSYKKLTYAITRNNYPSNVETEIQYITVQHGRPYALVVDYFNGTQQGDLVPLTQVITDMVYSAPAADAEYLSALDTSRRTAVAAQPFVLASSTVNTPNQLASDTDISIVAKNQLAVVRVGAINCFTLTLSLPNGSEALKATDACTGMVGSGSIITKDGHVVTNGHVTEGSVANALLLYLELSAQTGNSKPLSQYVGYLKAANIIGAPEASSLERAMLAGDANAEKTLAATIAKIPAANLRVSEPARLYAIQLGNEPIKIKFEGTKIVFNTMPKTVVPATFVDKNYGGQTGQITAANSDVAILKISKNAAYPTVELGSITDVKARSQITVVGFPGFVDGGLQPTRSQTIPTATQGNVLSIERIGEYSLVAATVPLAQGNSGGPAFDRNGKQIGIATYAQLSTTDPSLGIDKLSKNSYMRDIADAKALATKNRVTPSSSSVSEDWHAGIDAFQQGDYAKAVTYFDKTKQAYAGNYLVDDLAGKAKDKADAAFRALLIPSAAVVAAVVVFVTMLLLIIRHHRKHPPMPQPMAMPPAF